jgi:transcriptional antiterminator RfaH
VTAALDNGVEWYAIRTKPKEEERADINLRTWQVQTFAPKLRELCPSGYGGRYVSKPLFSSYIFARFNARKQLHNIKYTRGVQNVVSFGDRPIPIDDNVIDLIKDRIDKDGFIRLGEELHYGDKVTIKFGPLKNLVGIFQKRIKETERVKILLDAVSYQSHVLIDREMIARMN